MSPTRLSKEALLAVVASFAILATACSSAGDPDASSSTADGAVSGFGYVLDGLPDAYALCGVNTPSGLSVRSEDDVSLLVYGDGRLPDPYEGPLYAVASFEADLGELDLGEVEAIEVDDATGFLGGIDGFQLAALPSRAGRALTWSSGGRVVQLVVRNDDRADLASLAGGVGLSDGVASIDAASLPDEFVDLGDVYELEGGGGFVFSVDHQAVDPIRESLRDQLTLLATMGGMAEMEAFRVRAVTSDRVSVGDRPGVVADMGVELGGPRVVSWLVDDGVILRLFSFDLDPQQLLEVASTATRVDGEDWEQLVEAFGSGCVR